MARTMGMNVALSTIRTLGAYGCPGDASAPGDARCGADEGQGSESDPSAMPSKSGVDM